MAEKQNPAPTGLVAITVAPRRAVQRLGMGEDGEATSIAHGPGETLDVEPAEAKRLRELGFALPEPVAVATNDPAEA